ncbi:hypothetical protein MMC07_009720 [Pseudocyphellaria aurata]|nr:hypothetical protein [Pseudocyphellaria aurata]
MSANECSGSLSAGQSARGVLAWKRIFEPIEREIDEVDELPWPPNVRKKILDHLEIYCGRLLDFVNGKMTAAEASLGAIDGVRGVQLSNAAMRPIQEAYSNQMRLYLLALIEDKSSSRENEILWD